MMRRLSWLLLAGLSLGGCASDSGEGEPVAPPEEPGVFADYFDDGGYILRDSHALIIREISFFGQDDDGRLEGFDLDDKASDTSDENSCGHSDLEDASGTPGIDNQVGAIYTGLVGEATMRLNGAINEDAPDGDGAHRR